MHKPKRGDVNYNIASECHVVFDGEQWVTVPYEMYADQTIQNGLEALEAMARKEIKIELVADLEPDQFDGVIEAARDAARTMLTIAMMVGSKKPPTVKVITHDFLKGDREWEIDPEEVT